MASKFIQNHITLYSTLKYLKKQCIYIPNLFRYYFTLSAVFSTPEYNWLESEQTNLMST